MVKILDWQQNRKSWHDIFRALNEKNMQPRILYPVRLSLKTEGERKSFQDKQKLKQFVNTKPALQEILKGVLYAKGELKVLDQKGSETIHSNSHITGNTMAQNSYLSIVNLNLNGLNAPIKRHRVSEWIKKQNPSICCLQEAQFKPKDISRFKMRRWKTIYHAKEHQKKAGVAILIGYQLDFKPKTIIRDEEGHYVILKGSVQQEDLAILNIYAPNLGAANYINQLIVTKSKNHIDNNKIIVGDVYTPLTEMERSSSKRSTRK